MEDLLKKMLIKVKNDNDLHLETLENNNKEFQEYFLRAEEDSSISFEEKKYISEFAKYNLEQIKMFKVKKEAFESKYSNYLD